MPKVWLRTAALWDKRITRSDIDMEELHCTECSGQPTLTNGEYVCTHCGLVLARQVVNSPYQMYKEEGSSSSHNKAYVALGQRSVMVGGMGSFIDYQASRFFYDKTGRPLAPRSQRLFRRLKFDYNLRLRIAKRETTYRALRSLSRVAELLSLPDSIKDKAAYYYQKIDRKLENKEITSHITLMAYGLMLAVRESKENAPITLQEIAGAFQKLGHRVTSRSIIRQALSVKTKLPLAPAKRMSEDYLQRIVSLTIHYPAIRQRLRRAGLSVQEYQAKLVKYSNQLFSRIDMPERGGRNPFIFAVAVVYSADSLIAKLAKRRPILTQRLISKATNAAEYSVRDHYAKLLKRHILKMLPQT
jgi:transcription initiation factor TFIIIB Brf1 subunit/transcription initiation factor TFIIB